MAHLGLSRVSRAALDAEWRCAQCGASQPDWSAVCHACASFDTLAWSVAGAAEPAPRTDIVPIPVRRPPAAKIPQERTAHASLPRLPDDPGPGGGLEY
jgi:predicted ATP-dependent serine protease